MKREKPVWRKTTLMGLPDDEAQIYLPQGGLTQSYERHLDAPVVLYERTAPSLDSRGKQIPDIRVLPRRGVKPAPRKDGRSKPHIPGTLGLAGPGSERGREGQHRRRGYRSMTVNSHLTVNSTGWRSQRRTLDIRRVRT